VPLNENTFLRRKRANFDGRPRTARHKSWWETRGVQVASLLFVLGFHGVVLTAWPDWELRIFSGLRSDAELIQFYPILGSGLDTDPGAGCR
jgi:hypothetical protein